MEQTKHAVEVETQTETLESEVKAFAESLPYFAKFLCEILLSSTSITDTEIDIAYSYLVEDAGLKEKTERAELIINCTGDASTTYKSDLVLSHLQNLQGVNALVENQVIQFGPSLTIIYGINGSGKSGYIRLLKKVFFNRAEEQIIENVHIAAGHKKISAEFIFTSDGSAYTLTYPENCTNAEFKQFSVFDSKCVPIHLNNKNQFEFKPSGLNFFANLTNALKKVEEKINTEISAKGASKDFGHNQEARQELKEIFNEEAFPFDTPKPVRLLKRIIQLSTTENDIILDSFAGSATTAHAALELNKEDGGTRKFILVEQEDYANNITAERVRRVIKGVSTSKNKNLKGGLGGTFSYFTLGEPIEMESLLRGKSLPSFKEFARYLFFTSTGEEFNDKNIDEKTGFIGESRNYEVYMFYKSDLDWLKKNALTLELCKSLPKHTGKQRLVFAPVKYVDDYTLQEYRIDFCQLPFEIYRLNR